MCTTLIWAASAATTLRCSTRLSVPLKVTLSSSVWRVTFAVTIRAWVVLPPLLDAPTPAATAPAAANPSTPHRHLRTRSAPRSPGRSGGLLGLGGAVADIG